MPPKRRSSSSSLSAMSEDQKPDVTSSRKRATPKKPATSGAAEAVSKENGSPPSKKRGRASPRKVKKEESDSDGFASAGEKGQGDDGDFKPTKGDESPSTPARRSRRTPGGTASSKKMKLDSDAEEDELPPSKKKLKETPSSIAGTPSKSTLAKKLKQLEAYLQTPFPDHVAPTPEQCKEVQDALAGVHGLPSRPEKLVDREGAPAGCGAVPDVLDALVRTILSQNTTSANSTRAKIAMDEKYGRANYAAVHRASFEDLAETIACGGLANNKAKAIKGVCTACVNRQIAKAKENGEDLKEDDITKVSLDYLHDMSDLDAMKELVSFDGVGPKTASCVLLFCLGRNSFAVDTHVFRITKALGWVPQKANRETTFQHLDVRIPDENKYPLHSLFVRHGRSCRLCSANGNITEAEVDSKKCPIKGILKRQRAGKKGRKGEDDEASDDDDADELVMPGEVRDKEEEQGKPPMGAEMMAGDDVKPKVEWEGEVKHGA